jgi:hypothetical protein
MSYHEFMSFILSSMRQEKSYEKAGASQVGGANGAAALKGKWQMLA